jgi:hypothetical protein
VSEVTVSEPFWLRNDLHVVGVALLVLLTAWIFRAETAEAPHKRVAHGKLSVAVPGGWLADPPATDTTVVRGEDAVTGLELRITDRPSGLFTLESALELERGRRFGELYQRLSSERKPIGGRDVLRTVYSYAFKPTPTHAPRVASAVEYAFPAGVEGQPLYIVTLHAGEERLKELEPEVLTTIEVAP